MRGEEVDRRDNQFINHAKTTSIVVWVWVSNPQGLGAIEFKTYFFYYNS